MGPPSHGPRLPGSPPELELGAVPAVKPRPQRVADPESPFELAVDADALVEERSLRMSPAALFAGASPAASAELAHDARLLADYGDVPRHPILSPLYAYRVLKRRRELKKALAGRREEAARAVEQAEEALVAFAQRVRGAVEGSAEYSRALHELREAEELLRSRDRVLAAEQDAQNARRAQVEARIASLEAELAQARAVERAAGADLSEAQRALAREDARLKRAETEVRAARQRPSGGEASG